MLRVTVELLPHGRDGRPLGYAEIENISGDEKHASYLVHVYDEAYEEVGTATIADYPRFSATVWDLVARGVATALAGKEELPPRPTLPWK